MKTETCTHQHDDHLQDIEVSTPLHAAAERGFLEVAKCLVENGANVNAINRVSLGYKT